MPDPRSSGGPVPLIPVDTCDACPVCAGIDVVTFAVGEASPTPFCGRCQRRLAVRWVEPPRRAPRTVEVACAS